MKEILLYYNYYVHFMTSQPMIDCFALHACCAKVQPLNSSKTFQVGLVGSRDTAVTSQELYQMTIELTNSQTT